MPKNSTKKQQKRPGIFPGSIFALICTRMCARIMRVYVRVCAPARALVTWANQEARAKCERKTRSACATCRGTLHAQRRMPLHPLLTRAGKKILDFSILKKIFHFQFPEQF